MIRLVPEANPSPYRTIWVSLGAILFAAIIAGGLFAAYGSNPLEVYRVMLSGTLFETQGLAEVARRSIPLILIGVGLTLAFRAQFFNIGAEGQMLFGAVFAAIIPLFVPLGVLSIPFMLIMGAIGGGLGALLSAWLRQKYSVNEILSTLMLNYVAYYLVLYLIAGPWKGKSVRGFIYTDEFPDFAQMPLIGGTLVHYPTLILGIIAAIGLQFLLSRTTLGFELRVVGENAGAARYAGISVPRIVIIMATITGGLAGIAGAGEVTAIHHRLLEPAQISLGYGFTAIIVAWLARGHPILVLITAPFMGIILAGGDLLKIVLNMPFRIVDVFSGVMLMTLIASEILINHRIKWGK